jgi:glutathione S-transferase
MDGVKEHMTDFVWREIRSPEHLGQVRMAAMDRFLADFPTGLLEMRYLDRKLPHLTFTDGQFDLALCSHFLFSYTEQLGEEFHHQAIAEMCRVAKEVRIFPLMMVMSSERSPFVELVSQRLVLLGYQVEIKQVPYEFQQGGDRMMRITKFGQM